jgi:hypothetical protein
MWRLVLSGIKSQPDWKVIDADLVHLFTSWFDRGFLTLERINWLADISKRAIQRSAGFVVIYLCRLSDVEDNHESYIREHRVVAPRQLRKLARDCPLFQEELNAKPPSTIPAS